MSYCVGLRLNNGLVFMSDTRTNAGVDNVSMFKKLFTWEQPGERVITLLTAGNLATTQALISLLDERSKAPSDRDPDIMAVPSMFQVAKLVGDTLTEIIGAHKTAGQKADSPFSASVIVGGQIKGGEPRLFLVYPEGNFIEASGDTMFFQIGETKYGKPIIIRAYQPEMNFEDAVKLLLVSFDSTIRANISVDLPIDMQIYESDSLKKGISQRIERDDAYFQHISNQWGTALQTAFDSLPHFTFDK